MSCTSFQINAWNVLRLFFIQVRFFCWWSPLKKSVGFLLKAFGMILDFPNILWQQDFEDFYSNISFITIVCSFVDFVYYESLMMLHSCIENYYCLVF